MAGVKAALDRAGVLLVAGRGAADVGALLVVPVLEGLVCGLIVGVICCAGPPLLEAYGSAVAGLLISGRRGRLTGAAVRVLLVEGGC